MSSENMQPKISIVGAGISGLVLGRCLLQHNIKAVIFEKARQSQHRNSYGITLHPQSFRPLLQFLGLEESAFRTKIAVDAGVGGTGKIRGISDGSFRANRNRFESLLAEGLDVRWEHEVEHVEAGTVAAKGEKYECDVIVGADGPHSSVRQAVLPEAELKILPFAAYNGKRRFNAKDFEAKLAKAFSQGTVVEQRVGDALFQASVNDWGEEEVSISYTYSRPAKDGKDALFRPKREKDEAKTIPDELFAEVEQARSRLSEPLAAVFDVDAMRNDRLLNWLMRSIDIQSSKLEEAADQGIVLMGDSVHAEPILGGQGANVAIEDGIKLAEILASGRDGALREFYQGRRQAWSSGVKESETRIREMHAEDARATL